jgi:hypothetical protein
MSVKRVPADVAARAAQALRKRPARNDAFRRETFALPRVEAGAKARVMFDRFP